MSNRISFRRFSQASSHTGIQCNAAKPGPVGISFFHIDLELRKDQFPELKKHSPELYHLAILAGKNYSLVQSFEKTYSKVLRATSDVLLKLDETGKITMAFTNPKTASELVTEAVVAQLAKEMTDRMTRSGDLFISDSGKARFNKFNVVLSHLVTLLEIRKNIDNKNLVNQQMGARRREAMKKKVKFCLAAIAAQRLGTSKTTQFTDLYISLWKKYVEFESRMKTWYIFVEYESKLAGTYRAVPERQYILPPEGY